MAAVLLKHLQTTLFSTPSSSLLVTGSILWASWWIWKFRLSPKIYPNEPKQLPYWIPVIGHVYGMVMDSNRLFTYGRKYFGNTREIFVITVMGQELYIATSAQDVSSVFRATKAFDFNPIITNIFTQWGLTSSTTTKMYKPNFGQGKHFIDLIHEIFKEQLHPGPKLVDLQSDFLSRIDGSLSWDKLSGSMVLAEPSEDIKVVSLFQWTYEVLVSSATRAFFGDVIFEIAPDLLKDFLVFDKESWKLGNQYPRFAAKEMFNAKDKCEAIFEKYLALPESQRKDSIWVVQSIEDSMEGLGISKPQTAIILCVLFNLINTNAYKTCFWCISHLLQDKKLLESIISETKPAIETDSKLSMTYLLEKCPLLNSFYEEVVRESTYPIGSRVVMSEATVGNKVLHPGKMILMPFNQLHSNPDVFGADALEFDAKRFLNKPALTKSTSYRPFGGGPTLCPGRFLARREIFMFLILVLHRFEIMLEAEDKGVPVLFPRMDDSVSSGGAMAPRAGDDLIVRVKIAN